MSRGHFERESENSLRLSEKPHSAVTRNAIRPATHVAKANKLGALLLFKQVVKVGRSSGCSSASIKVNEIEVNVSFAREEPGEVRGRWTSRAQSAEPADGEYLLGRFRTPACKPRKQSAQDNATREPRKPSAHDAQRSADFRNRRSLTSPGQSAPPLDQIAPPPGLSGLSALPPAISPSAEISPTEKLPPPTLSPLEKESMVRKLNVQQIVEVTRAHYSHAEQALDAADGDVANATSLLLDQAMQQEKLIADAKRVATQQKAAQQAAAQQAAADKEKREAKAATREAKAAAETAALLRDSQLAAVAKQAGTKLAAERTAADLKAKSAADTAANREKQLAANAEAKAAAAKTPKLPPATRSAAAASHNHYLPRTTLSGTAKPRTPIPIPEASVSSASPPETSKPNAETSASSAPSSKSTKPAAKASAPSAPSSSKPPKPDAPDTGQSAAI